MFDRIDIQRIATASFGGLLLCAACLAGAVGTASAAEPVAQAERAPVACTAMMLPLR